MTHRLHRLIVLAALTLVVAAGLWVVGSQPTLVGTTSESAGGSDVMAVAHRTKTGLVTVRLRAPTPCTDGTNLRWEIGGDAWHVLPTQYASERHGTARLYARLRVFRV